MEQVGPLQVCPLSKEIRRSGQPIAIGSRAYAILEVLIASRGELVSKDALMRNVWPDTIVEENNLQVQITTLRKLLGDQRHLIRTVPGRGYVLLHEAVPSARLSHATASNDVPATGGSCRLIGRREASSEVDALLGTSRVVTLVGAGGIGKTRLAYEVAAHRTASYAEGVIYIPLAGITDERSVVDALATALRVRVAGGRATMSDIVAHTATWNALVVLDNCEHVIDVAARFVESLTTHCAHMHVLATSREALRLSDEQVYPVPPLAVPAVDDSYHRSLEASAVELFIARTRAVDPHFPIDAQTVALTGVVCRRLDGIPLAIELAAARAATLGIAVLLEHLDDRFLILTGGLRTALPRHQTLRATFDWSYRLLDAREQRLFRWLGAFAEGFSFDAACIVTASHGYSRTEVLEALGGLVAKSLVVHDHASEPHYRMLESTRAYSRQQLEDNGEYASAAAAHTAYMRASRDRLLDCGVPVFDAIEDQRVRAEPRTARVCASR